MAVMLAGCAAAPPKLAVEAHAVGASWAWGYGGSRSDAEWIGAAAGASVGFVIGFVAGLAKTGSGWSRELTTPPACLSTVAESTAPAEDNR
jgi:hypothetical protein